MKTITVEDEVWKKIVHKKAEYNCRSLNDVLKRIFAQLEGTKHD